MAIIQFIYLNNKYTQNIDNESEICDILKNYCKIICKYYKELYFMYKGKSISLDNNTKIKEFKNNVSIFVFDINKKRGLQKEQISCPICDSPVSLIIKDDKISIENCFNKHYFNNLSLNEFTNIIGFKEFEYKCECGNSSSNYKKFYICTCKKYFCPLCYIHHSENLNHILIDCNERFYICNIHNSKYISLCGNCNVNLCNKCEYEHSQHTILEYKRIIPSKNKINEFCKDIEQGNILLNKYNSQILELNNLFTNFIFNMKNNNNDSLKIYDYLSKELYNLNNYENIKSIENFKIKKYLRDVSNLLNKDIKTKIKYLFDLYLNFKNELTIIYYANKKKKIRLFGENFVKNNKNNCFIFINNKKKDLSEFYYFDKINEEILIIKLVETKTISDMSFMFCQCDSLYYVPNFSNWCMDDVTDMKYMFCNCFSLKSISDISKWNTSNVSDMQFMFFNCRNLTSLPDISNWKTSKVTDMGYMFFECKLLRIMPDLSKWDIGNTKNISYMFSNCESLSLVSDISNWNVEKVTEMQYMFSNCIKLLSLPDITKWNINKDANMKGMFSKVRNEITIEYKIEKGKKKVKLFGEIFIKNNIDKCYIIINNKIINLCEFYECEENEMSKSKLEVLFVEKYPITNMSYMFYDCEDLISIYDINEMNTKNVLDMSYMFYNCKSLLSLTDILKWNMSKDRSINHIYYNFRNQMKIIYKINNQNQKIKLFGTQFVENNKKNCLILIGNKIQFLTEFYNIEKNKDSKELIVQLYEINNIENMSYIFDNCNDLISLPDISEWNTLNVKDMSYMFSNCTSLSSFNGISNWNTKNTINLAYMFNNLNSLLLLPDISNWDLSNSINISNLFSNCESLESLPDISKWNISKVESLSNLFYNCKSLTNIPDISKWKTTNTKNISNMFYNCKKIKNIPDISVWNTENINDMSYMFHNCNSLLNIPDISKWNISNVNNMSFMFWNCTKLISFPNCNWNGSNIKNLSYMFGNCQSLISMPDIKKWNIRNIYDISHLFCNIRNEINIKYYINKKTLTVKLFGETFIKNNKDNFFLLINNNIIDECENYKISENNNEEILTVRLIETKYLTDLSYMFENCQSLIDLPDISQFDISKIDSMSHMFYNCIMLKSLNDISKWNTQNIKDASYMFYNMNCINELPDISKWNTETFMNVSYMFMNCKILLKLPDISNWNTKNIRNMSYMFSNCESITSLPDISKWDMSNVNNISYMFYNCNSLSSLPDISKWNISNVENMNYIFYNCLLLSSFPDISKWDFSNVKYLNYLLGNCKSLSNLPDISMEYKKYERNEEYIL